MEKYLEIGQIVNTFGIKGQVKIVPFTDDITRFDELKEIYVEKKNELKLFQIEQVNYKKNMVILKLKGIETVEEAEKLRNCYLKIDRKDAKKLPKDTYFIVDLLGLDVYTDEGKLLGKVDDIYNAGSSDIYVVKDELGKQILLPAIKDVLKEVDLENQKIIVHLIKGLVD
ncbi:MAG: ribosome maturation factor RimM [Clostridium sp.]|jgi:16S rRNA processing protein rimM|nr:ribosome maturation factor RimM [Clostridium sp.]CCZ18493.1 ribosome maturation factor RimM [Clostridium sp. CAG:780]